MKRDAWYFEEGDAVLWRGWCSTLKRVVRFFEEGDAVLGYVLCLCLFAGDLLVLFQVHQNKSLSLHVYRDILISFLLLMLWRWCSS